MNHRRIRTALLATLALCSVVAPAASGAPKQAAHPRSCATAQTTAVDGVEFGCLPAGLGERSEFESVTDDDVTINNSVWESRSGDGWRVDLSLTVAQSPWLSTPQQFHEWLVSWQERPSTEARYRAQEVNGRTVWVGADQAFWLVRPGVGAVVRIDRDRWSAADLRAVVRASVR